jgi:N-acetylneuraminic acid mutarotase
MQTRFDRRRRARVHEVRRTQRKVDADARQTRGGGRLMSQRWATMGERRSDQKNMVIKAEIKKKERAKVKEKVLCHAKTLHKHKICPTPIPPQHSPYSLISGTTSTEIQDKILFKG